MSHKCYEANSCICYQLADEPDEKCPVHSGYRDWPARCCECGRFIPYVEEVEDDKEAVESLA